MKWFKHDSNAAQDAKLERLMIRHGLEGYGLYWYCLELIAAQVETHNLTFELEHDAEILSRRTGLHQDRVQDIMRYMVDSRLFEQDRGVITCLKMATRTDEYTQKILKKQGISPVVPRLSEDTPDSVGTKSVLREEKRIDKNRTEEIKEQGASQSKKSTRKVFKRPTLEDLLGFISQHGYSVDAQQFVDHYNSNGWRVGKNAMKDWKACVRNWERRDEKDRTSNRQGQARPGHGIDNLM
ncbi:MAG: DUF4373 domain-containing protein [Gammaproteobacteria bacterium]|nr:DUF4373 domain-containing protein [Gammaproteobacteria bacterium]